jgi:HAD superfamily hydrolase (TIGR01509 family)
LEAVIFDFDGVLVDTEPLYADVVQTQLRAMGISLTESEYLAFVGTTHVDMWSELKHNYDLEEDVGVLAQATTEAKLDALERADLVSPMPGIPELLSALADTELSLAIVSSSELSMISRLLCRLSLLDLFTVIIHGGCVDRGKPDPEGYLLAATQLGCPSTSCLVIEDSTNGVLSARAAGMTCIGYECGSCQQDLTAASHRIPDFSPASRSRVLELALQ